MSRFRVLVLVVVLLASGPALPDGQPQTALAAPPEPFIGATGPGGPVDTMAPLAPVGGGCTGCFYKLYAPNRFVPNRSDLTFIMLAGALRPTAIFQNYGFMAPLDLPTGTSLQQVTFHYVDSSPDKEIEFQVLRFDGMPHTWTLVGSQSSTGSSSSIRSVAVSASALIDSGASDYVLYVIPGAANGPHEIWGAMIAYRTAVTLPMVLR
jgi:hypothetical protein